MSRFKLFALDSEGRSVHRFVRFKSSEKELREVMRRFEKKYPQYTFKIKKMSGR